MAKAQKRRNNSGGFDLLAFTKRIIKHQTTADQPGEIAKCLQAIEEEFKGILFVRKHRFRKHPLLVLSTCKGVNFDIILSGHVDVVPAKKDDYIPKEKNGRLYGRGAMDMKSSVAACLFAVREYVEGGGKAKVAIIVTSDEELDGLSTKWLAGKKGYRAKLAILPDGGDEDALVLRQKGSWQIRVSIKGKSAHASRPWEGDNTLEKGYLLYSKLLAFFPLPTDKGQWKTSIALTKIEGGKALNQIPDAATFYFDIRYTSESVPERITKKIEDFLGQKGAIETISQNGEFSVDQKNPLVLGLKSVMEKELHKKIYFVNECGTSDAIFFVEHGTPAVLFRPRGGGMHQDGEWVDIESLNKFHSIILSFLNKL